MAQARHLKQHGASMLARTAAATSTGNPSLSIFSDKMPGGCASNVHGRKTFDLIELGKLAAMQCTLDEIASWFGVSHKTIDRKMADKKHPEFRYIVEEGWAKGRIGLRRSQYQMAMAGDKTMLIWLGKQYLAQADHVEQHVSGKDGKPIQHEIKHLTDEQLENIICQGTASIPISVN